MAYMLKLEVNQLQHLDKRQGETMVNLLGELRTRVGFFNIYNLFEKVETKEKELDQLKAAYERLL